MNKNFGFSVLPEEQHGHSAIEEAESGTLFVDVHFPPRYPDNVTAICYYKRNFAKDTLTTLDAIRARFPQSFAQNDAGEEYTKTFGG